MFRCGEEFLCDNICGHKLNCGVHDCESSCHEGDCYYCEKQVDQSCFCGKCERQVLCTEETARVQYFSCEQSCDKLQDCGLHKCKEECHPGDCAKCNLTIQVVKTCPCGQTELEKLYENDDVKPRKSCVDPIPTCGKICNAILHCGPPGNPHKCEAKCHTGPCPTCPETTILKCRCGHMDKELPCSKVTGRQDDVRCEKRCQKKKCGRHKCGQLCCIEIDHICTQICGKMLSCGLHRQVLRHI